MKKTAKAMAGLCVAAAGGLAVPAAAEAAFVDGTVAVVRLGNGTGTAVPFDANNLAQQVNVDVYNVRTGGLVSSYALPSGSADAGRFVLSSTGSDDTGRINLSADGRYLTLGGYRSNAGAANPTTSGATRVVARLDANFTPDTSTSLVGAYSGVAITSVVSTDGTEFWTAGGNETTGSGGLRYVSAVGGTSSVNVSRTQTGSNADSYRGLRIIDSQLVGNTASQGSFTNRGAYRLQFGASLPRATTPTAATATPVIVNREGQFTDSYGNGDFDNTGTPASNGKQYPKTDGVYLDLNGDGVRETAYTTGGKDDFEKWTLVGSNWVRRDSMFLSSGLDINALEAFRDGSSVDLLISTDTGIYKVIDNGGIGTFVDPSGQLLAADAFSRRFYGGAFFFTPGANNQFRGLALVPEPTGAGLVAAAATTLLGMRRRRRPAGVQA